MRTLCKSAIAAASLITASAASAGDYQPAAPAPVVVAPAPVAIIDWSGPYAGIVGSYNHGMFSGEIGNTGFDFPGDGEGDFDGAAAGIVLGYSLQSGNFVYGAELNYAYGQIDGSEDCVGGAFDCGASIDQYGSIRANAGFLMQPRTLVYATAGWARANAELTADNGASLDDSQHVDGWVYGLGVEHALTNNINLRGAIVRHDFSSDDFQLGGTDINDVQLDFTSVELGVLWRF